MLDTMKPFRQVCLLKKQIRVTEGYVLLFLKANKPCLNSASTHGSAKRNASRFRPPPAQPVRGGQGTPGPRHHRSARPRGRVPACGHRAPAAPAAPAAPIPAPAGTPGAAGPRSAPHAELRQVSHRSRGRSRRERPDSAGPRRGPRQGAPAGDSEREPRPRGAALRRPRRRPPPRPRTHRRARPRSRPAAGPGRPERTAAPAAAAPAAAAAAAAPPPCPGRPSRPLRCAPTAPRTALSPARHRSTASTRPPRAGRGGGRTERRRRRRRGSAPRPARGGEHRAGGLPAARCPPVPGRREGCLGIAFAGHRSIAPPATAGTLGTSRQHRLGYGLCRPCSVGHQESPSAPVVPHQCSR